MNKILYPGVVIIPEEIIYRLIGESPELLTVYMLYKANINLAVLDSYDGWEYGNRADFYIRQLEEMGLIEKRESTTSGKI